MRRISFWFLSTVSAVVLLFGYDASRTHPTTSAAPTFTSGLADQGSPSTGPSPSPSSDATPSTGRSATGKRSTGPSPTPSATPAATLVTGAVANTVWGPVQVQLRVSGGSITKVGILQYPQGNGRDIQIANYALPVLIRETIAAQSASIDMVSGATYTSTGYVQSLQSALDRAHL